MAKTPVPVFLLCEFFCYSLFNIANLTIFISERMHQVSYYITTFNSALIFSIVTPILIAAGFFVYYFYKNNKITFIGLIISLMILTGLFYEMTHRTLEIIYSVDNYNAFHAFVVNYFINLFILIAIWLGISKLGDAIKEWGSMDTSQN